MHNLGYTSNELRAITYVYKICNVNIENSNFLIMNHAKLL